MLRHRLRERVRALHVGEGTTTNACTAKTNSWPTASVGNNKYADINGNVYHNDGSVKRREIDVPRANACTAALSISLLALRRQLLPRQVHLHLGFEVLGDFA